MAVKKKKSIFPSCFLFCLWMKDLLQPCKTEVIIRPSQKRVTEESVVFRGVYIL
jgi:hypothetical protein